MAEASRETRTWLGHPPGLTILFLTETAAYFSAYGMQALLVLYMIQARGIAQAEASTVYGLYVGFANLTPILGGYLADRYLGKHRAVTLGASLMALGHLAMAWESALYAGLGLIALGNGFFITSLVSRISELYADGDPRRDRAYLLYYLGINIGSFIAPLLCGWLAQAYGWRYGFTAAGLAMAGSLIFYLACQSYLPPGDRPAALRKTARQERPKMTREAMMLLGCIMVLVVLFRLGYEQMGNTIALWIDTGTSRALGDFMIPTPWFQSLNPLFIFALTPILTAYWGRRARQGKDSTTLQKMTAGCAYAVLAFAALILGALTAEPGGNAALGWTLAYFFFMTMAEVHVLPVGLSLVGKLSPAEQTSFMVGIWYFAKFVASLAAGSFGTLWTTLTPITFFTINAAIAGATMIAMFAMSRSRLARRTA